MAGLQAPLSTLRRAPRDALRMTRGHSGLLFLSCPRLSLFTLCRSPGALACFFLRFVRSPPVAARDGSVKGKPDHSERPLTPVTTKTRPARGFTHQRDSGILKDKPSLSGHRFAPRFEAAVTLDRVNRLCASHRLNLRAFERLHVAVMAPCLPS